MIKWVVFDLSGVIFTEGFRAACKRLATLFSLDEAKFHDYLKGEKAKGYRLGEQDPVQFWNGFGEEFGIKDVELAKRIFFNSYTIRVEALEFVDRVRKSANTAFFTFSPKDRADFHEQQYHFLMHFDAPVFTYQLGVTKSEPEAYAKLCAHLNAKPEEVVMIDDTQEYIKAAESAGVHAILFEPYSGFEAIGKALRGLGLEIPPKPEDPDDDHEKIPM